MRALVAFDVNHTSRRIASAFAGFAVALTMVRFACAPRGDDQDSVHDLEFVA